MARAKKPMPITETEYAGTVPNPNTVMPRSPRDGGQGDRELEPHERLRLGRLTGQEEDIAAPRKTGFMHGVDPEYPAHPEWTLEEE